MAVLKGQLVCEHLENIQGKVLEAYPNVIREFVKGRHGVYALYHRKQLYYVGLASNLRNRLKHHLNDRHAGKWERFSIYITNDAEHMKDLESLLLRIAAPKGNQMRGGFVKSVDLVKHLDRQIRDHQNLERTTLVYGRTEREQPRNIPKEELIQAPSKPRLALAGLLRPNQRIRCQHKGKRHVAKVRKSGLIVLGEKHFKSPSAAGKYVTQRATSGWTLWRYQDQNGQWLPLSRLRDRKADRSTTRAQKIAEYDTIICPARDDGFHDTFLGENCWYAIRLNAKKIPFIRYCAIYRRRPTSAITHYARVSSIDRYKNTGKYILRFAGKPHRIRAVKLNPKAGRKRPAPQGPCFAKLARIRAAKTLDEV